MWQVGLPFAPSVGWCLRLKKRWFMVDTTFVSGWILWFMVDITHINELDNYRIHVFFQATNITGGAHPVEGWSLAWPSFFVSTGWRPENGYGWSCQKSLQCTWILPREVSSTPHEGYGELQCSSFSHLGMDQYLLIPFLVGWTSIYQLFWCSPGVQGFDTLPNGKTGNCGMLEPSISLTVPMARLVLQSTRGVFQKGQTSMRPQVAGRLRAVRISGHGINQELEWFVWGYHAFFFKWELMETSHSRNYWE